jgi:hypothetical protein
MRKQNFCLPKKEYVCTAKDTSLCKFYMPYSMGGCKHQRITKCINERAWKDADEKQRAEEYSGKKLTV